MTDTQMLTLAVAVIVPLSLLLYSNGRITEAKETLRADIKRLEEKIDAHFEHMEMRFKLHELEHHPKP